MNRDSRVYPTTGTFGDAIAVVLCLVPFVLYKLGDLQLPYFWDEVGVYARAALYLHDHTLGLLPKHLPPELSRGHPLLLAFLVASAFRAFGPTPGVAHLFMLILATGLVASVYWIALVHWGRRPALVAMALLLVQPLFVAQSTLVLPEVALAFACLWTLHCVSRRRYLLAGVWLTLALYLKETAIVLDLVIAIVLAVRWREERPSWRAALGQSWSLLLANLACVAFFVTQRVQNGWFFFPEHVGYVDLHGSALEHGLWVGARFVFVEQGRWALSTLIGLWLVRQRRASVGFIATLCCFGIAVLVFSAANVFMKRYLMCLLPPLALVGGRALVELMGGHLKRMILATAAVGVVSLSQLASQQFNCEYDMGYREAVRVQQQATEYVVRQLGPESPIVANFPTYAGLEDPRFGYSPQRFENLMPAYFPEAEYIFASEIFEPFEPPAGVETTLIRRFSSPYMNIALYRILPRPQLR